MQEIGYRSWGLVPVDSDPSSGMPSSTHPPMISTLALDRGASLVIELAEPLAEVHLRTRLTALSTEGETGSNMRVLSARAEGAFEPLSTVEWEKTFEGMDAVFTVPLRNVGPYLKIHSQGNATFVISTVNLSVP
jgi:hypothetical protein